MTTNGIAVGFHVGRTLLHLADNYARPNQVVLELVQNAIDADAKNIYIKVNAQRGFVYCADDGIGESFDNLTARFQRISEQQKSGKMGHKGIGNLASLAISGSFSLTTRPRSQFKPERFFTVELNREGLEDMADQVTLPSRKEPKGFRPGAQFKLGTDFAISTLLIIKGVKKAAVRVLKDAASVAQSIEARFAPQITKKGLRIIVEAGGQRTLVQPTAFPGTPNLTVIETKRGNVTFDLYVGTKPEKKPQISIVHGKTLSQQYSIPFTPFLAVSSTIQEVFGAGYLQGNIYVPFCTLTPDREEFEYDDDLAILWEVLDKWAQDYGRNILDKISSEKKELKIAQVILNALRQLEIYLVHHKDELARIFAGEVSAGHLGYDQGKESKDLRSVPKTPRIPSPGGKPTPEPSREQKGKVHSGVRDAGGSHRRVVSRQTGIQVEYRDPLPEEGRDWRSKREDSTIIFNSLHPDWQKVESDSKTHTSYCFHLLLKEIVMVNLEPGPAEQFNDIFEGNYIAALVEAICPI